MSLKFGSPRGTQPFKPLCNKADIILKFSSPKIKQNSILYNSLVTEDYEIEHINIEREKVINKVGRLDIYIEITLLILNVQYHIKMIIENKVESKENNDQTNNYFNHFNSIWLCCTNLALDAYLVISFQNE